MNSEAIPDLILDFAGEARKFYIGWAGYRELEETIGQPLMQQIASYAGFDQRILTPVVVREVIRLGLIGGGMQPSAALACVRNYVEQRPIVESIPLALRVIEQMVFGSTKYFVDEGDDMPAGEKANHVMARFNGADVRFRLDRKYAGMVEPHGGWAARMQRLLSGSWTIPDVLDTLQRAHPNVSLSLSDVPRAIEKNGPATYAPLALTVIAAALGGIAPESAVWSDEDEADDAA